MNINTKIPSIMEFVPNAITGVLNEIEKTIKLSEDDAHQLRLILEEALTNAVQHGNKFNTGLMTGLDINIDSGVCKIVVTDEGEGFDASRIPDPVKDKSQKPTGRGIYLIKQMADQVSFNDKGTVMTIVKKLSS